MTASPGFRIPKDATLTPFQRRVYEACVRIPAGRAATYGALGRAIGCGSARAVGQALKRNPFAPGVPCHRVVRSDGGLGGFSGRREGPEVARKRRLLEREGVRFDPDGRVAADCLYAFSTRKLRRVAASGSKRSGR